MPRQWLRVEMQSANAGVEVTLQAHPKVEEFMKAAAGGKEYSVVDSGGINYWIDPKTGRDPKVWLGKKRIQGQDYILGLAGYPITGLEEQGYSAGIVNLSILQIVGCGKPEGVKFNITLPMSVPEQMKAKTAIANGFRSFVRDNMSSVKVELIVMGRQV